MLISSKGRYAVRMLVDIAMYQKDGVVPMKDVARRQQLSKKYLESFTAQLAAAGILTIRRGKTGGYRLLKPADEITVLDILRETEGPMHAVACLECEPNRCERAEFCPTLSVWAGLEKAVYDYLSSVTLQDLIDKAKPQPDTLGFFFCGL